MPLLPNGKPDRVALKAMAERAHARPASSRSRCAPASAASPCARACCWRGRPGGGSSARSWSTTPRPARPGWRCAGEAAHDGWPDPVRVRRTRERDGAGLRPGAGARDRAGLAGLPHREGQGGRGRADAGRRRGAARGRARRARRRRAGADRRQRRLVGRRGGGADPGAGRRPPAGWSTSSSRARRSRTSPLVRRRGGRADRGRRVDPPGRGPLPGARPRGRRRRGAQGAAAGRRARLPADRRGHRAAGRGLQRAWSRASGSPPGSRWPPRCPSCRTPAGWRPCSCSADDVVDEPLLPVGRDLPVRRSAVPTVSPGRRRCDRLALAASLGRRRRPRREPPGVERRSRRRRSRARDDPRPTAAPRPGCVDALVARGRHRRRALPRARATRRCVRAVAADAAGCGCTPGSTSARPASSRSGIAKGGAPPGRGRDDLGHRGRQPASRRARGRARRGTAGRRSPPTVPPGCAAPARTRPPTRSASTATPPPSPTSTTPDPDALAAAWHPGGPIHLNVQLDDPLVPIPDSPWRSGPSEPACRGPDRPWTIRRRSQSRLAPGKRTVVVAGDDAGPPARQLAEQAGWPLLAEPSSGSRTGTHPIRSYRLLLGTALGERVERAVVFGHPTLSRPVLRLLAREGVEVVSVPAPGRWPARPFPVDAEHAAFARRAPTTPAGSRSGVRRTGSCPDASTTFVRDQPGLTPYDVAAVVDAANPPGGLLVVGASNPIRDLDLMAGAHPVGERRMVLANRGLAGIDGTVSSAIGAALGRPHSSRAMRLRRRRDVPPRRHRAVPRAGRAATRPDDRGGQRRRRLDLRDPRARRAAPSPTGSSSSSAPPTTSTWPASAPPAVRRTGGSTAAPSSSTPCPRPTAASRWSRPSSAATTGASSTRPSGP